MLAQTLKTLRKSGKKVFIVTNSFFDFTHVVLNYVLEGKTGKDRDDGWLDYFDAVITAAGKPRFFTERKDLFEVRTEDFSLKNLEGGSPMMSIEEEDLPGGADDLMASTAPAVGNEGNGSGRARVFQGGSWHDVHRMLGVKSGSDILYVGDHVRTLCLEMLHPARILPSAIHCSLVCTPICYRYTATSCTFPFNAF